MEKERSEVGWGWTEREIGLEWIQSAIAIAIVKKRRMRMKMRMRR
jgi:hypothetical protein